MLKIFLKEEIQTINNIRTSDLIDIRPRVSPYTVLENSRSPLEFFGRLFNKSGNSATNILASDESLLINYSFYLGRIDRIYFTKNGKFGTIVLAGKWFFDKSTGN